MTAKSKPNQDRVNKVIDFARKNKVLSVLITAGIIIVAIGTTSNQLDNILTFCTKYFTKRLPNPKNPQTSNFACRFHVEVLTNVKELDRIIEDFKRPGFDMNNYKFIYDDYDKYHPAFDNFGLDVQIKNFYTNLKKIAYDYSYDDLLIVKSQGKNILDNLTSDFGCRDYFEENKNPHAASSDTGAVPTDIRRVMSGVTIDINSSD